MKIVGCLALPINLLLIFLLTPYNHIQIYLKTSLLKFLTITKILSPLNTNNV